MHIYTATLLYLFLVTLLNVVYYGVVGRGGKFSLLAAVIDRLDQVFFIFFAIVFSGALLNYAAIWLMSEQPDVSVLVELENSTHRMSYYLSLVLPSLSIALTASVAIYILAVICDFASRRLTNAPPAFYEVHRGLSIAAPLSALVLGATFFIDGQALHGSVHILLNDAQKAVSSLETEIENLAAASVAADLIDDTVYAITFSDQLSWPVTMVFKNGLTDENKAKSLSTTGNKKSNEAKDMLSDGTSGRNLETSGHLPCYRSASTKKLKALSGHLKDIKLEFQAPYFLGATFADKLHENGTSLVKNGESRASLRDGLQGSPLSVFVADVLSKIPDAQFAKMLSDRKDLIRKSISSALDSDIDVNSSLHTALMTTSYTTAALKRHAEDIQKQVLSESALKDITEVANTSQTEQELSSLNPSAAGVTEQQLRHAKHVTLDYDERRHEVAESRISITGLVAQHDQRLTQGCEPFDLFAAEPRYALAPLPRLP